MKRNQPSPDNDRQGKNTSFVSVSTPWRYIDRYDISDTGSTDRTKEIVEEWVRKTTSPEPFMTFLGRDSVSLVPSHLEMPTKAVPITLGLWMLMTSSKGTSSSPKTLDYIMPIH